jgi:TonB-linked SusC/RagA family outer membrane protein
MKLTAVLLLTACLTASADGISQKVSLSEKNARLEKVFKEIKKQTGFDFFYNMKALEVASPVTIEVKNATLVEVLDLCFKNQPLSYTITDKMVVVKEKDPSIVLKEIPPPIDVKGRLVNENGEPVAGATITVKGTNNRTASDDDGYFLLSGVDENATLVISATNIDPREVKVAGKTDLATISVKIKVTEGQAVVVEANTGYQKIKPNEINGSVVIIDNKKLNEQTSPYILDRIKDITSGVYFNAGKDLRGSQATTTKTNISIRGLSTINGPLDPLIILDNFIFEGDLNNINPNDIENITVLKDASAASIWGARAANGVIVITTKKGRFNQKFKLELNTSVSISEKPHLSILPQMSSGDFIDVEKYLFARGYKLDDTASAERLPFTPVYEILLKRRSGIISATDSTSQLNALRSIDSRDEYLKYFYKHPITQQYSLNLRGGGTNIAWLISGNYNRSAATLQNTYDKVNVHFENNYKPINNLIIGLGVYFTNSDSKNNSAPGYNSIANGSKITPYIKFLDDNGNAIPIDRNYRGSYTDTAGGGRLLNWKYFPLEDYKHNKLTNNLQEIVANANIKYSLNNNIQLSVFYQYQIQTINEKRHSDIESFAARDLINKFTILGPSSSTYNVPRGGILSISNSSLRSQNLRGQVDYNKSWKDFTISAIGGAEIREIKSDGNLSTIYGYNKDPLSFGAVDFNSFFPTYITGSYERIPNSAIVSPTLTNEFVSFYLNGSLQYLKKYSLSLSGRKDASNTFGLTTNDKWNPLWSVGIGWNLSNENFYKSKIIPVLRLRTSLGYGGNLDVSRTALPIAGAVFNGITNLPVLRIGSLNNPSLRWETSRQINIGLDFSGKMDRISGSIDYYLKKGTDLYGPSPLDYTTWGIGNTVIKNVASMSGKGVDLMIQSRNIQGKFSWFTTFLYSNNSAKTTKYFSPEATKLSSFLVGDGRLITPVVNKPLYAIVAYKWGGLNSSGDPQGFLNGQLSTDYNSIMSSDNLNKGLESGSFVYVGPSDPVHFGSIVNSLSWKGIALSFNISYKLGYYFKKPSLSYNSLYQTGAGHKEFENRWKNPGDESFTSVPAMRYIDYPQFIKRDEFYSKSEINILKGDHIRFQYINLSYSITKGKKKMAFENIQVYCNVSNIGIIWRANKYKLDPDNSFTTTSLSPSRTYTMGVRLSL